MSVLAMLVEQTGGLGRHRRIQSRPDERSPVSATGAADTEPTMSASLVTAIHPPALMLYVLPYGLVQPIVPLRSEMG